MSDIENRSSGRVDDHVDELTALLYLDGELEAARTREVAAHAETCAGCRELLRALETEGAWLRKGLTEEEPLPARLLEAPERGAAPWGWIGVFGLAAGGAYTVWSRLIDPWLAQAAQAGFTGWNLLMMLFFSGAFWKGWDAMGNTMEILSVATVGTIFVWLVPRFGRRLAMASVALAAILCAIALAPSAGAAEVHHGNHGDHYMLAAGQEVKTDLIVTARSIEIDGDVDGDLIVWSQSVTVNGHVKGDILCWAQHLQMNGSVDGNVRSWVQDLSLNGTVGKNVMDWSQDFDLADKAKIGGTLTLWGDHADLNGPVAGDLLAWGRSLQINGVLGRDACIRAERLSIGPTAAIAGQTKYTGGQQPDISPGAKLGTPIQIVALGEKGPPFRPWKHHWHPFSTLVARFLFWVASFLFGLVMLLLVPGFFRDATNACQRIGPSIGFGFLFLVATPIAVLIACLTIVGLGLGIVTFLLYLIAVYSAQIFVGAWIGEKILGASTCVGSAIGRLALGLAIVRVARMLPYLGGWVCFLVVIWGLGALILATYKRLHPQVAAVA